MTHLTVGILLITAEVCVAQSHGSASNGLAATSTTIKHDHQCVNLFVGISRKPKDQASQTLGKDDVEVYMGLSPNCGHGFGTLRTGVWPEFSKDLRFKFAFSKGTEPHDTQPQPLSGRLTEDNTPVWRESGSTRTLRFILDDLPPDTPGELFITVLSAETRLTQLKFRITVGRGNKPKQNRS